jgi:hypothetical protein
MCCLTAALYRLRHMGGAQGVAFNVDLHLAPTPAKRSETFRLLSEPYCAQIVDLPFPLCLPANRSQSTPCPALSHLRYH